MPELVYSLGSPSHDYAFLLPFYSRPEQAHVLHAADVSTAMRAKRTGEVVEGNQAVADDPALIRRILHLSSNERGIFPRE